jgi:hypothetical protein
MAALKRQLSEGRWSRTLARQRWADTAVFAGRPLGLGLVVVAVSFIAQVFATMQPYPDPLYACGAWIGSVGLVGLVWFMGPRGLSLALSVFAGAASLAIVVVIAVHIGPTGIVDGQRFWVTYWLAGVPAILAFGRPAEEAISIGALISLADVVVIAMNHFDAAEMHLAPGIASAPLVLTTSCVAVIVALRASVARTRAIRLETQRLEQQTRMGMAAQRERLNQLSKLDERIAPLLQEIGAGTRRLDDRKLAAECKKLAHNARTQRFSKEGSIFELLLARESAALETAGGVLSVQDVDAGFKLYTRDRLELVNLVRRLCDTSSGGSPTCIRMSLRVAGDLGYSDAVLVVLDIAGVPAPEFRDETFTSLGGNLTTASTSRWWWDKIYTTNPAPSVNESGS